MTNLVHRSSSFSLPFRGDDLRNSYPNIRNWPPCDYRQPTSFRDSRLLPAVTEPGWLKRVHGVCDDNDSVRTNIDPSIGDLVFLLGIHGKYRGFMLPSCPIVPVHNVLDISLEMMGWKGSVLPLLAFELALVSSCRAPARTLHYSLNIHRAHTESAALERR